MKAHPLGSVVWPGGAMVLPVSKPKIKRTTSGGWICYRLHAAAAGAEFFGRGGTPAEAFDSYQRLNKHGEYGWMASDLSQAARSLHEPHQRTDQEENAASEKLKRFSRKLGFALWLMFVAGTAFGFVGGLAVGMYVF